MIIIKEPWEISIMKDAGNKLAEILLRTKEFIQPGMSTRFIDSKIEEMILKSGCVPILKGYKIGTLEYKFSSCISINEEVVHAPPSNKVINEDDIISIDVSLSYCGYCADSAISFEFKDNQSNLINKTKESLDLVLKNIGPGIRIGDIGFQIQDFINKNGLGIVTDFAGHGIGRNLHEDPIVPNFGKLNTGLILKPGMTLAIEPMVTEGLSEIKILEDGWTASTVDGKRAAHFEHTIAINYNGIDILTKLD